MAKYFSIILDESDQNYLKRMRCVAHPRLFCHHVTVAFNPTLEQIAQFTPLIGRRFVFNATSLVTDEKGQAMRVEGVPSLNKHPHITISCAEGVSPVYSNELLDKIEGVRVFGFNIELSGTMHYGN